MRRMFVVKLSSNKSALSPYKSPLLYTLINSKQCKLNHRTYSTEIQSKTTTEAIPSEPSSTKHESVFSEQLLKNSSFKSALSPEQVQLAKKLVTEGSMPPLAPLALASTGLIPLIIPHLQLIPYDLFVEHFDLIISLQLGYAVTLLSFMGAIHFGTAMAEYKQDDQLPSQKDNWMRYVGSVLPFFISWGITQMSSVALSFSSLAFGFAFVYALDIQFAKQGLVPKWYLNMRTPLTILVVLCLMLSAYRFGIKEKPTPIAKELVLEVPTPVATGQHTVETNSIQEETQHAEKEEEE